MQSFNRVNYLGQIAWALNLNGGIWIDYVTHLFTYGYYKNV